MRIMGLEITKGNSVHELRKQVNELFSKQAEIRPSVGALQGISSEHNLVIPYFKLPYINLYHIAHHSDVLRTILISLRREIFRRGSEVTPVFVKRCDSCEKDFDFETTKCDNCGGGVRDPGEEQKKSLEKHLKVANDNDQSMMDVFKSIEDDENIVDEGFLLFIKEYTYYEGRIIGGELKESLRVNPLFITPLVDKLGRRGYNEQGQQMLICPLHRDIMHHTQQPCSKCGCELYPAHFKYQAYGATGEYAASESGEIYYIEGEIVSVSKYSPGMLGGFPPILSVWKKLSALMGQDVYINDYYGLQRPPKGVLLINTRNRITMERAWEWLLEKSRDNPHIIWPFAIDSNSQRGTAGQFINFMNNLQEMQFTEQREEFRRTIGALYGVMPIFQGDVSTGGGLNNEGLQITVTNRAIESGQSLYNDKFYPALANALGVTDWKVELLPSEERDEMAEIQKRTQEITNARGMLDMGFEVKLDEENNFEFSGEAKRVEPSEASPFGSLPTTSPNLGAAESMASSPERFAKTFEIDEFVKTFKTKKFAQKFEINELLKSYDYDKRLEKFGDSPEAVGWMDKSRQTKRFQVLSEVIKSRAATVLDVGAGLGHFKDYLQTNGFMGTYEGIEKNEKFVQKAKEKGLAIKKCSLEEWKGRRDYVVASGVWNTQKGLYKAIPKMVEFADKGVAFNFLVKAHPDLQTYELAKVLEVVEKTGCTYDYKTGYLDGDATVFIYKENHLTKGRLPKATKQRDEVEDELFKELEKELKGLDKDIKLGRKKEKEVKAKMDKLAKQYAADTQERARKKIKKLYNETLQNVEKELGLDIGFGEADTNAIEAIKDSKVFQDAFKNLDKDMSKRINKIIGDAFKDPKKFTMVSLTKEIKEAIKLSEGRIATIARTETTKIANAARINSYEKSDDGSFTFKWLGPADDRTTGICKNIKRKTEKGVSMKELLGIIQEEANKADTSWSVNKSAPAAHVNCRHTIVRVI